MLVRPPAGGSEHKDPIFLSQGHQWTAATPTLPVGEVATQAVMGGLTVGGCLAESSRVGLG